MLKKLTSYSFEEINLKYSISEYTNTLQLIAIRPDVEKRKIISEGEISLEKGLVGDNWLKRGSKHTEDGSSEIEKQLTLMNTKIIQAICNDKKLWKYAGDQLFVDMDLSEEVLPIGTKIKIGDTVLEVSNKPHTGCKKFRVRYGDNAMKFINTNKEERRRGINAIVLKPGKIAVNDKISILN